MPGSPEKESRNAEIVRLRESPGTGIDGLPRKTTPFRVVAEMVSAKYGPVSLQRCRFIYFRARPERRPNKRGASA